jgi:two-component sensor histidine kinase
MTSETSATITQLLNQQQALAEFGSFAFHATDLKEVLKSAVRICAERMSVDLCKICQYRPEHDDLVIVAGYGWHQIEEPYSKVDSTSPGGRAFVTGQPVICEDLTKASDFVLPDYYTSNGVVSSVNVIIPSIDTASARVYGILQVDSKSVRRFERHDINFLTSFGNVVAEAVANMVRAERLQAALDERELLARELQHRVRNNLHLVYSMLNIEAEVNPGAADSFRAVASRVQALAAVYDHLLGSGLTKTISFNHYLDKLCSVLRTIHPGNIELNSAELHEVVVDLDTATAMGIAVTELIGNCYKHAFPDGEGQIAVKLTADQEKPVLSVQDTGVGINLDAESRRHGLGLVRRLAQQVGATLEVARLSQGTQCRIILPLVTDTK